MQVQVDLPSLTETLHPGKTGVVATFDAFVSYEAIHLLYKLCFSVLWLTEKQRSPFLRTKADILLGPAVSFQNCFLSFQTLQINGLFKAGWTAQPLWGIYFKAVLFFILHHDNKKDKEPAEESKQRVDSTAWQSSQVEHISDVKQKKKRTT